MRIEVKLTEEERFWGIIFGFPLGVFLFFFILFGIFDSFINGVLVGITFGLFYFIRLLWAAFGGRNG